jgi:hypothetical protein
METDTDWTPQTVRAMIDRENELVNHRITWLTTGQGLLFAALGFLWDKPDARRLIIVLCVFGIAYAIVACFALVSASLAMARICYGWQQHGPIDYEGPGVIGLGLTVKSSKRKVYFLTCIVFWNWLPILFIFAWIAMFVFLENPSVSVPAKATTTVSDR